MTKRFVNVAGSCLIASMCAQSAFAGGMAQPIVEAETITEDAAASAVSPLLIGLIALVLIAAFAGGGGGGGGGGVVVPPPLD